MPNGATGRWIDRPDCSDPQATFADRTREAKMVVEYEKVARISHLAVITGRKAENVLSNLGSAIDAGDADLASQWCATYCSLVDRWIRLVRLPACPKSEGEGLRRIIAVSGARTSNMSTRLEGMIVPTTPVTPAAAEPGPVTPTEPAQAQSVAQS